VREYAESVLPGETPAGDRVRVTQSGEMVLKPGARPLRFEAVEEFETGRVAFAWRARFRILGPLSLRVLDSYQPPKGRVEVRLLGAPVQRKTGTDLAMGEAFRYLAEIPWVPQAITTNPEVEWRQLDGATAEVSTEVHGETIAVRLLFGGNEIVQTVAERPRLEAGGALTRWVGEFRDYTWFNGIRMPARGEVRWELPEGPFTYWRGSITSAECFRRGAPVPIERPRLARASAGASSTPSPAIATMRSSACRRLITSTLSAGMTSAITSSMPTSRATAWAVALLSPVSRTVRSPSAFS
jgi:hypothetical protein